MILEKNKQHPMQTALLSDSRKSCTREKKERFVCLVLPKAADLCGSHVWMRFVQWPCTVLPPSSSRPWLHLKLGSQQDHVLRSSEGTTPLPSSLSHDLTVTINSGEEAVFETQISKSQQCRGEWVKHFFLRGSDRGRESGCYENILPLF